MSSSKFPHHFTLTNMFPYPPSVVVHTPIMHSTMKCLTLRIKNRGFYSRLPNCATQKLESFASTEMPNSKTHTKQ